MLPIYIAYSICSFALLLYFVIKRKEQTIHLIETNNLLIAVLAWIEILTYFYNLDALIKEGYWVQQFEFYYRVEGYISAIFAVFVTFSPSFNAIVLQGYWVRYLRKNMLFTLLTAILINIDFIFKIKYILYGKLNGWILEYSTVMTGGNPDFIPSGWSYIIDLKLFLIQLLSYFTGYIFILLILFKYQSHENRRN